MSACGHWVREENVKFEVGPSEQNAEAEPISLNNAQSVSDKIAAARTAAGTTEKAVFTSQVSQVEIDLAFGSEFATIDIVNLLPIPSLENVFQRDWLPPVSCTAGQKITGKPAAGPALQRPLGATTACTRVSFATCFCSRGPLCPDIVRLRSIARATGISRLAHVVRLTRPTGSSVKRIGKPQVYGASSIFNDVAHRHSLARDGFCSSELEINRPR